MKGEESIPCAAQIPRVMQCTNSPEEGDLIPWIEQLIRDDSSCFCHFRNSSIRAASHALLYYTLPLFDTVLY